MVINNMSGPSAEDNDPEENVYLEFYPLILALARKEAPNSIGPCDSDDVAQVVCLKLLLMPVEKKASIKLFKNYLRTIVHNVVMDFGRKYKSLEPLSTNEEGEICKGRVLVTPGEEYNNPEDLLLQKEALLQLLSEIQDAVSDLSLRQKQAAIYRLKEDADIPELEDIFQKGDRDTYQQYPLEKAEQKLLNASYSHARRKLANQLDPTSSSYRK